MGRHTGRQILCLLCIVTCVVARGLRGSSLDPAQPRAETPVARRVVPYKESYARKAMSEPIASQLKEMAKLRKTTHYWDPLADVALSGGAPKNDKYIKIAMEKIQKVEKKGTTEWLDSANEEDRLLLGRIIQYCTNLFAKKGADRDCVVQCHPPVNCGVQAARLCQNVKGQYEPFVRCTDRERQFCKQYGHFHNEKFPNFKADAKSDLERTQQVAIYCGDLFQMRGVDLNCLRECTIFEMREKNPDHYFMWKAKHRLFVPYGAKDKDDPTERQTADQTGYIACEHMAVAMCKFLQQAFWRECYERVKFRCLRKKGTWNPLLGGDMSK